ncbi:ABC transporter substrate-binding protein [Chitinimonas sp. BJYL2]|uniref:substrate-binding periplasmic protein n=1 Tax=Chitinimonas sp. BJYL2 TaxID=2976696 RepID=UPI0022B4507D|nr:transporter substrate-binding domain-containing protein [Chitinimonas sp. BJYL2]
MSACRASLLLQRCVWLGLAVLGVAGEGPCTQLIASGNPEYPPYLWRDPLDENRLIGANAKLMARLSDEIGIPILVKYAGPWGRVQEETRAGRVDLIAGAFFTLPRLDYMDYFQPAITRTRTVIWSQQGRKIHYTKWRDLVGHRGLTVINNSFGEAFDRYAEKHLKIEKVARLESALRMLSINRGDYVIYEEEPGKAFAARLNLKGLVAAQVPVSQEDLFLTFSHNSRCNTGALRGKIARAMHKLAQENVIEALLKEGIQQWRAQED